jgi:hypothetical protein
MQVANSPRLAIGQGAEMNVRFDWPAPLPFSSCIRIRLAHQPGCFRRIPTTTTSTSPLHRCGHEFGRQP